LNRDGCRSKQIQARPFFHFNEGTSYQMGKAGVFSNRKKLW